MNKFLGFGALIVTLVGLSGCGVNSEARVTNGEGYNGPDRSGVSIPASLDRAYQVKDLRRGYQKCLELSLTKIYKQLFRSEFPDVARNDSIRSDVDFPATAKRGLVSGKVSIVNTTYHCITELWSTGKLVINGTLGICYIPTVGVISESIVLKMDKALPTYLVTMLDERRYDELGQFVDPRTKASQVVVSNPGGDTVVSFKNSNTNVTTSLSVNFAEMTQCLASELQNGSQQ